MPRLAPTNPSALLASLEDAGELLGVSRSTIYKLVDSGQLRSMKVAGRRMVVRDSITDFISSAE